MENPFKGVNERVNTEVNSEADNKENLENKDSQPEVNTESSEMSQEEHAGEQKEQAQEKAKEQLNPWEEKYNQLNNQYIRLAADFDNYRKRQAQEREALLQYGAENTLKKLIEVLDNFDRGIKAIETVEDCEKVKECYNLAYKNFTEVLAKLGLETIKAEGEEFDPNFHEAVMQTPTEDKPEHTIIAELQKGYKLGDKVLRPTLVNVATAP